MSEGTQVKVSACLVLGGVAGAGVLLTDSWYLQVACALVALVSTACLIVLAAKK